MLQTKTKIKQWLFFVVTCFTIFLFVFSTYSSAVAANLSISANNDAQVKDLQEEMAAKKAEIDKIQKKLDVYTKSLEAKRQEKITLQNELEVLSENISKISLQINKTNLQIDSTNLEIQSVLLQILDKEDLLNKQKNQLADLINLINLNDQKSYLEILIDNNTFGDFFDQVTQLEQVESGVKKSFEEVKILKQDLQNQQNELQKKSDELNQFKVQVEGDKFRLDNQESAKTYYLAQAKKSEKKFQSLISQSKLEQQQINNEITSLEKTIRKRLEKEGDQPVSAGQLIWPVPKNTITAYFHDPDYPFRNIFEHPAIDVRAGQSTPVKAADNGYVAVAKNGGAKGYSYIMIIHDNGLATVYGHVSKIYVTPDTPVRQGDIIGLSGGMPGTAGAGRLTTGPHMHFEVRLNGIPVNPLDYLP